MSQEISARCDLGVTHNDLSVTLVTFVTFMVKRHIFTHYTHQTLTW